MGIWWGSFGGLVVLVVREINGTGGAIGGRGQFRVLRRVRVSWYGHPSYFLRDLLNISNKDTRIIRIIHINARINAPKDPRDTCLCLSMRCFIPIPVPKREDRDKKGATPLLLGYYEL
jgi:hypothetical protein